MIKAVVYKAKNDKWYARIIATNGEPLFKSGDGYENRSDAVHACHLIEIPTDRIFIDKPKKKKTK